MSDPKLPPVYAWRFPAPHPLEVSGRTLYQRLREKWMQDPEFKRAYLEQEAEFEAYRKQIEADPERVTVIDITGDDDGSQETR